MTTSPRPPADKNADRLNITGLAENIRENGVPYDDDRIASDDRGLRDITGPTWQEQQGQRVAAAAGSAVQSETIREATEPASQAEGLFARAQADQPRHEHESDNVETRTQENKDIRNLGHSDRARGAKGASWAAKSLMVLGDTFLMGSLLSGSGSNPVLAGLAGASIATGAVATGSMFGREYALAKQRKLRGPATDDTPIAVRSLTQSPDEGPAIDRLWAVLTVAFMSGVGVSIGMLLWGTVGILEEAIGLGVVTGLTVLGSAAAEAYGTNAAADRLAKNSRSIAKSISWLEGYNGRIESQSRYRTQANWILAAGAAEATSASLTHQVMASPMAYNPRQFGYEAREDAATFAASLPALPEVKLAELNDAKDLLGNNNRSDESSSDGPDLGHDKVDDPRTKWSTSHFDVADDDDDDEAVA